MAPEVLRLRAPCLVSRRKPVKLKVARHPVQNHGGFDMLRRFGLLTVLFAFASLLLIATSPVWLIAAIVIIWLITLN